MARQRLDVALLLFWGSMLAVFALMLFVHGRTHGPDGLPMRGPEPPDEWWLRQAVGIIGLIVWPTFLISGIYLLVRGRRQP
jgi:hypothetical protein